MVTRMRVPAGKLSRLVSQRSKLLGDTSWVTASFVVQQVLRLGTSVVLAWLLAPELLGAMVLINALRTGGELLSDVGIGQSIVRDPRGDERRFHMTAWTLQITRGCVVYGIFLLLTVPLIEIYDDETLGIIFPVASFVFIITGFASPGAYLLQRRKQLRRLALFGMASAAASSLIHIGLAAYSPTIWALVWGLLLSSLASVLGSFFLVNGLRYKLVWDKTSIRSIVSFGRWVLASSFIYFLAMNFDRLYFAEAIPIGLLGVYGIARTLSDAINLLFQRVGGQIVFPRVAASRLRTEDLRVSLLPLRRIVVLALALALATGVALSDAFIFAAYDDRYRLAAIFLPVLLVGAWFATLSTLSDAIMMGIGKPSSVALANAAKLAFVVLIVPQVLPERGLLVAIAVISAAEALRYVILSWKKRSHGLSFMRQDLLATLVFFVSIPVLREITAVLGITGGLASWVSQVEAVIV